MVQSKYTTVQGLNGELSTQRSSREGRKIDRIILHHQASTNGMGGVRMMVKRTKQVSANYVVLSDGAVVLVVPEEYRAWTSASASWDGRAITFEVENSTGDPTWRISEKAEEKLAQMVVDIASRYNFPINRDTVIGHRELYQRYGASYATACPGGMRLDWIVQRAQEIQRNGSAPAKPAPTKEELEEAELMAAKDDIIRELKSYIDQKINESNGNTNARASELVSVVTREGRNARAYENTDTGEAFIAEPGVFFVDLGKDNPEASANLYAADGWVQNWSDRKRYPTERFEFVKRQYLRTIAGTSPAQAHAVQDAQ